MRFFTLAIAATAFIACPAWAKHPQCAGNPEPEQCEKMRNELDNETPAQKKERLNKVAVARAYAIKIATKSDPEAAKQEQALKAQKKKRGVHIGMSQQDALDSSWGRPRSKNRTTNANGTTEQWVYDGGFLYFDGDTLTTIQN